MNCSSWGPVVATEVIKRMQEEPGVSARREAQATGHTRETVHRELKSTGLHPYRISILHKLLPADFAKRNEFCQWFKTNIANTSAQLPQFFFSPLRVIGPLFFDQIISTKQYQELLMQLHYWKSMNGMPGSSRMEPRHIPPRRRFLF